jgi:hypothetical protein
MVVVSYFKVCEDKRNPESPGALPEGVFLTGKIEVRFQ